MVIRARRGILSACLRSTNTHKVQDGKFGVYLDKTHVQGGMGRIFLESGSGVSDPFCGRRRLLEGATSIPARKSIGGCRLN
jgi:hypothetical protein